MLGPDDASGQARQRGAMETSRVDSQRLGAFYRAVFVALGTPPDLAPHPSLVLLEADLAGNPTHGLQRLPVYIHRLQTGGTTASARPVVRVNEHGRVLVNGQNGLGQVVAHSLMSRVVDEADARGHAIGFANNSNHVGALNYYPQMAAQRGQIGLFVSGVASTLAPTGGTRAVLGSNPWGVAIPYREFPIVMDLANGMTISDRLRSAAASGETVPPDHAIDSRGQPTTDPERALAGSILPAGGYKGYLLTLFLEVLASVMSGAAFSTNIPNFFKADQPKGLGHFAFAVRTDAVLDAPTFEARIAELVQLIRGQPAADPEDPPRLPGERAHSMRQEQLQRGIRVSPDSVALIRRIAAELSVEAPI